MARAGAVAGGKGGGVSASAYRLRYCSRCGGMCAVPTAVDIAPWICARCEPRHEQRHGRDYTAPLVRLDIAGQETDA